MARRSEREKEDGAGAFERQRAALYAVPPSSFIDERNARAKQLADEGRKAESARLKQLRRPAASVWAANALSHVEPAVVKRLLAAGNELRLAQRKTLSGVGAEPLRAATGRLRDEVHTALETVTALLIEAGESHSQTVLERTQQTLLAAAQGSEALRDALRAGRLDEDLSPAGFGDVAGLWQVPSSARARPAPKKKTSTTNGKTPKRARQEQERSRRAQQQEAQARRAALQSALQVAQRDAARRRKALERARTKLERAVTAAEEAEARARQIRARADEAAREFAEAEAAETSARSAVASAKEAMKG